MAQLSSLLGNRQNLVRADESNLEQGRIWFFSPGAYLHTFTGSILWCSPGTGTAQIEVWGAAGSGAGIANCGLGIPGNPGAYARKTICVDNTSCIIGTVGMSCGNADALCFRGCSTHSDVCWTGVGTNGCICAQGGRGGENRCVASAGFSPFCCFTELGFCSTNIGSAGCGIVCNKRSGDFEPLSDGGDVNCPGGFSCLFVGNCDPQSICSHKFYVRTSAGKFGIDGGVAEVKMSCGGCVSGFAGGQYVDGFYSALSALSKSPTTGTPLFAPYGSGSPCGCYQSNGCHPRTATGVPGLSGYPCNSVVDYGMRGGHGGIRIRFLAT